MKYREVRVDLVLIRSSLYVTASLSHMDMIVMAHTNSSVYDEIDSFDSGTWTTFDSFVLLVDHQRSGV